MARGPVSGAVGRDVRDKAAFLAAFLAGTGGILVLKLPDISPVWGAAYSVLVLLAYLAATWAFDQLSIEPEAVGDNCYYLGFLFTLTSLVVTLYRLAGNADQASAMQDVISGFGIALASTIAGVFLRVLLMQIRPDLVSRDRETRAELQHGVRDFRAGLAASLATMKSFGVEATQLAAEQSAKIGDVTDALVLAQRARVARDAETCSEVLRATLAEAAQASVRGIDAAVGQAAGAAQAEIGAALAGLSQAVAGSAAAQASAFAVDAEAAARRAAAVEGIAAHVAAMEALSARIGETLESMLARLKEGDEALAAGTALLAAQREAAARLGQEMAEVQAALAKAREAGGAPPRGLFAGFRTGER